MHEACELWPFKKYSGCGNDFILFDNRQENFPLSQSLIRNLCHRQKGIGADGLLLLENSLVADFRFRIFNADGGEAEMCGNGLRCFVHALGHTHALNIETMCRILLAECIGNNVCIEIAPPPSPKWNISFPFEGELLTLHFLDTGVPHAVFFTEHIDAVNLSKLGPCIRHSPHWGPSGANATLAEVLTATPPALRIRTYERGVERETLACGTGAAAAALAGAYLFGFKGPVMVETLSQEKLKIDFLLEENTFTQVTLEGPAALTFSGEIDLRCF